MGPEKPLVDGLVDYLENLKLKFSVQINYQNLRVQNFYKKNL